MTAAVAMHPIEEAAADIGVECRLDEPLARHTTMGVGGPTPFFLLPRDAAGLAAMVRELAAQAVVFRVLGAGSNVIVADEGVRTPVLSLAALEVVTHLEGSGGTMGTVGTMGSSGTGETGETTGSKESGGNRVRVGGGEMLPRFVRQLAAMGLSGLEFSEGIPGTVGGGLKMNAGAGGRWLGDLVREVSYVTLSGALEVRTPEAGAFGYRSSFIAREGLIAVDAVFEAVPDDPAVIRARMRDARAYRLATQPLSERSSGCIFKNPEEASAGAILEELGLKGTSVGGAVVSDRHANFIVNRGGSATDVLALAERVRGEVRARTGVELEYEVLVWKDAVPGGAAC